MSEYIGKAGCIIIIHSLDVFVRLYSTFFPMTVAVLR
jgi:hypothetical protein